MTQLYAERCIACRRDSPSITADEVAQLQPEVLDWEVLDWELLDEAGIPKLDRTFRFSDFVQALAFTNAIGDLAEEEGHHPKLTTEWGRVQVTWWTHKIRNLHRNDFIMAAKTDQLYQQFSIT